MKLRRVLITRALDDAEPWSEALSQAGFEPVVLPLLTYAQSADTDRVRDAIADLGSGWVVLTSSRAVPALKEALPLPAWVRVAAVGVVTAHRLKEAGVKVDLVGDGDGAAGLARAFARLDENESPERVLWLTGNLSSDEMRVSLKSLGFEVEVVEVYKTVTATPDRDVKARALENLTAAVFASPSAVRAFVEIVEEEWLNAQRASLLCVAIGATTEGELVRAGFKKRRVAPEATAAGVLEALTKALEEIV